MKFYVDFNYHRNDTKEIMKKLGIELVWYEEHSQYEIEINKIEELKELQSKLNNLLALKSSINSYDLLIDFEDTHGYIYFDHGTPLL